jgi:hypothetical protein
VHCPASSTPTHGRGALGNPGAGRCPDWKTVELRGIVPPMRKARVIVQTVSAHHQIYVEQNGARTLYAVTDKLPEAKVLVLKAKRELGIARGIRALFQAKSRN